MLQVTFKSYLRESPLLLDSFVLSSFDTDWVRPTYMK